MTELESSAFMRFHFTTFFSYNFIKHPVLFSFCEIFNNNNNKKQVVFPLKQNLKVSSYLMGWKIKYSFYVYCAIGLVRKTLIQRL